MDVRDFDFGLPAELIAQEPHPDRSAARLLYLHRGSGAIEHHVVSELPDLLQAGDVLVVNNTRVFPARLLGRRVPGGGRVECLLIRQLEDDVWEALVHPGQRVGPGSRVVFEGKPDTARRSPRTTILWPSGPPPLDRRGRERRTGG